MFHDGASYRQHLLDANIFVIDVVEGGVDLSREVVDLDALSFEEAHIIGVCSSQDGDFCSQSTRGDTRIADCAPDGVTIR